MRLFPCTSKFVENPAVIVLAIVSSMLAGCHSQNGQNQPAIQITRVPATGSGGPLQMDSIEGKVTGAAPGDQIVLYARSDVWWIQPYRQQPFTRIQSDQTWKNTTHLGTEYAALLVEPGYSPQPKIAALPAKGNGVVAVAVVKGVASDSVALKTIHFSGYDWNVRTAASDRGGVENLYDAANAWTDEKGYLHLRMQQRGDRWTCAEVDLTRSLGYGTYRFVVEETAKLPPSAVTGMLIWDEAASEDTRKDLDIELSRWDNPTGRNAQYVVQPYYLPGNVARFEAPEGELTHSVRWDVGAAAFKSYRGTLPGVEAKSVASHVFTAGIPTAGVEKVHLDLFEFRRKQSVSHRPAEVVIEKFEYLP
jgi:hypothetical protein